MKKILLLGSLFSVIIAQASETQDQKVSEFISALKQGASGGQNGATNFFWGGHLHECGDAVSQLVSENCSTGAIKHVIEICNGTGSDGQGWVQGTFWPWARLIVQARYFSELQSETKDDVKNGNLTSTERDVLLNALMQLAQLSQYTDFFLLYVLDFQSTQRDMGEDYSDTPSITQDFEMIGTGLKDFFEEADNPNENAYANDNKPVQINNSAKEPEAALELDQNKAVKGASTKVKDFIANLKNQVRTQSTNAVASSFSCGGHLEPCRFAVRYWFQNKNWPTVIKNVIQVCNGTGSDGQKWVQTVFWPRARLMLQVNFFNDFLVHIGEDKVGMNLLMTFLEFAQKHQDLFLKYVANFQFSQ